MSNSVYLITGGTGSFGIAVLQKILQMNDFAEIRIFSRDDKKHLKMKDIYKDERIRYYIGDIKDPESIDTAMKGADYVFHAAALKLVPSCENNPLESVKVNIIGSYNVLQSAVANKVKKIIMLSTDKTIYPISTMGASKLLMEKIVLDTIKNTNSTEIVITRFGNIVNSTGSVIENFLHKLDNKIDLVVTGKNMTRFMMKAEEAADLVWHAFEKGVHGSIYVSKMAAFSIENIARAFITLSSVNVGIQYTDPRVGDRYNERLVTHEEEGYLIDEGQFYRIADAKTNPIKTTDSSVDTLSLEDTISYFKYLFQ